MDVLASAEFRKRYAKLTEPTVVTVNGHVIGRWLPTTAASPASFESAYEPMISKVQVQYAQGKRDDLLRKINRQR